MGSQTKKNGGDISDWVCQCKKMFEKKTLRMDISYAQNKKDVHERDG